MECVVFFGLIIVVFLVLAVSAGMRQKAQVDAAREAYEESLNGLKADPNNPELRQQTLQLGRVYSNLTRNEQGVAIYDEVALKNDIDAACAGAVRVENRSIEDRLAKLRQLHAAGHISDDEYYSRRQSILDDV